MRPLWGGTGTLRPPVPLMEAGGAEGLLPRPLFDGESAGRAARPRARETAPDPPADAPGGGAPAPPAEEAEHVAAPQRALGAPAEGEGEGAEAPPEEDQAAARLAEMIAAAEQAQREAAEIRERYQRALAELERVQKQSLTELENDLTDLAIEIAREILLREVVTDRRYVVRLVEAALRVAIEDEAATVLVAPADQLMIEKERERLEVARGGGLIRISVDPALHPGDCIVQVGRARIDARLSDRLERLRQALHGVETETD